MRPRLQAWPRVASGNRCRVRSVGGRGGHLWTLSAGGSGAAGCGGEGAEGGDGIGEFVGQTGGDGIGPAEHGGFGGQRCGLGQPIPATGGDGFGEEEADHLQLALHLVVHGLGQRLIGIGIDLVRSGMDQRDGDALLVQRPAHVGVQRHDADAADRTGAGQDDPVGLGGQDIASRQGMFRDKGVDRLLRPRRPDAICQIEGPGDLATEAVDVQRDAAHAGIGQRRLQLGGDPLIGGQARGLPDPGAAMHQRARDFDHGDAVDHGEGLAAVALMALGEIVAEQRGAGGQGGCGLIRGCPPPALGR